MASTSSTTTIQFDEKSKMIKVDTKSLGKYWPNNAGEITIQDKNQKMWWIGEKGLFMGKIDKQYPMARAVLVCMSDLPNGGLGKFGYKEVNNYVMEGKATILLTSSDVHTFVREHAVTIDSRDFN